jgi:hypothetical protein
MRMKDRTSLKSYGAAAIPAVYIFLGNKKLIS